MRYPHTPEGRPHSCLDFARLAKNCEPTLKVSEVVDLMVEEKVGALPVVDPETDTLVGTISYVDVLAHLVGRES